MKKTIIHTLDNTKYNVLISVLDYEISLNKVLKELKFYPLNNSKKVLVDLALLSGIDQYRFVEFDIDNTGKIIVSSHNYVSVDYSLEEIANGFLREKSEIVKNSILTDLQKNMILY